jgi:hypothetical protein
MRGAVHEVGDRPLARWLTTEVPRALLAGEDPPPRPASRAAARPGLLRRILGG